MTDPFADLPKNHFGAILADPPWTFECWADTSDKAHGSATAHYKTLTMKELQRLPVSGLAAENCVLFTWVCWPTLPEAIDIIHGWNFDYKTCAFSWMKADVSTVNLFSDPVDAYMGLGYWTRANSEVCLLATRGKPKRLNADVRQGIIAPRREHSRKPDGIHERIERLVAGPYLELFARQSRPGWTTWGNEVGKFNPPPDKSPEWDKMWDKPFEKPELL